MNNKVNATSSCEAKDAFNLKHKGKKCCNDQKITIQKTYTATVNKQQLLNQKPSFDVLFVLNFVCNWLGFNFNEDTEDEPDSSPGLSVTESLTILFKQFRI